MRTDQRGSTLISQLLALAIIGSALIVFITGLATTSLGVRVIERRVSAENMAREQMEIIKAAPYQSGYDPPAMAPNPQYTMTITVNEVATGLQRVRVEVYTTQESAHRVFVLEDLKGNRS